MKRFVLLLLLFASFICFATSSYGEDTKSMIRKDLIENYKISNNQLGTKYIVAIPPNETKYFGWSESSVEIHISAMHTAKIKLNVFGVESQHILAADEIFKIDASKGLNKTSAECREYNTVTSKTIQIESDIPVAVYVYNFKNTTSDGYNAIPVEHWGTEYYHCGYYDNFESLNNNYSGGFLVMASEDNTVVNVMINGIGTKKIATIKGDNTKSIGDKISFKLNAGEVYQIATDGQTKGEFDISGTKIKSDKPIGVISYHLRTALPIFSGNSRDHLSEMILPKHSLGTQYASICLSRGGSKKGDLFRIMATEDNTSFIVKWYDLETKKLISTKSGSLHREGDFQEISSVKTSSGDDYSITGTSIFIADKPIMIMQYSYSGDWDNYGYDPIMFTIPSVDSYVTHTLVNTPLENMTECNLSLIANIEDSDNPNESLRAIKIDGTPVLDDFPEFLSNKIPGTTLYWIRIPLTRGSHYISSNDKAKFGAYLNGIKGIESYGFYAAANLKDKNIIDNMPPIITHITETKNSIVHKVRIQDDRYFETDSLIYKDSGIWYVPLSLISNNYGFNSDNYKQAHTDFAWLVEYHEDYTVNLEVENIYKNASVVFYVADNAGNVSIDSLKYFPHLLTLKDNAKEIDFGRIPINSYVEKIVTVTNTSEVDFYVNSITIEGFDRFLIESADTSGILTIGSSFEIKLKYYPKIESMLDEGLLVIQTDNIAHKWQLKGRAFTDKETLNFAGNGLDFGLVTVNESKTKEASIQNNGEVDIEIEKISMKNGIMFSTPSTNDGKILSTASSLVIPVSYSPTIKSDLDADSIIIKTSKATYSYPVRGKADDDISVFENAAKLISISPNPLHDNAKITVKIESTSHLKAKLFDVKGQLVKNLYDAICNKGEISFDLDAESISSGTYTLIIEIDNMKYSMRVLVQK